MAPQKPHFMFRHLNLLGTFSQSIMERLEADKFPKHWSFLLYSSAFFAVIHRSSSLAAGNWIMGWINLDCHIIFIDLSTSFSLSLQYRRNIYNWFQSFRSSPFLVSSVNRNISSRSHFHTSHLNKVYPYSHLAPDYSTSTQNLPCY